MILLKGRERGKFFILSKNSKFRECKAETTKSLCPPIELWNTVLNLDDLIWNQVILVQNCVLSNKKVVNGVAVVCGSI